MLDGGQQLGLLRELQDEVCVLELDGSLRDRRHVEVRRRVAVLGAAEAEDLRALRRGLLKQIGAVRRRGTG